MSVRLERAECLLVKNTNKGVVHDKQRGRLNGYMKKLLNLLA
jgi:hypothetical protein